MNALMALMVCSALIASLNPCTLSVLIMSISSLSGKGRKRRHIGVHIVLFALGIFAASALLGLAVVFLAHLLSVGIVGYLAFGTAILLCLFGLFEIKDYFWYGRGWSFQLSAKAERRIHSWTKAHHGHLRAFGLGLYTSVRLLHYSAPIIIMNALLSALLLPEHVFSPMIWSLWYTMPLLFIATLSFSGVQTHGLLTWKEQSKHTMRLSVGLLYVLLGWICLVWMAGGLKLL